MATYPLRKIIHVDMDCFYAAIEIRDQPHLVNKPVAIGGLPYERGVLCTCNYIARRFGVKSAMATSHALKLCPDLVVLPVNMQKYRDTAKVIHQIFHEYTSLVEPLSLDEAYLDVSNTPHCKGSATLIAKEIREKIYAKLHITASAGVAPNKFLAKIASGWRKPNGLFVIHPDAVSEFIKDLPIHKINGVGKVTSEKLKQLGLLTCLDLQKIAKNELTEKFGKLGFSLYDQCRGIDLRPVEPNRIRKSLSVERTFHQDIYINNNTINILDNLYEELILRLKKSAKGRKIKNQYVKIKFSNFKQFTLERINTEPDFIQFKALLWEASAKENFKVRLIGIGVHFVYEAELSMIQQSLF